MIKAADIKKFRAETGLGVMECKKALSEAKGDFTKALEFAKKQGALKAKKKADREIKNGRIEAYVHDGRVAGLVKLGCETDFVAKNEQFVNLAHDIAMQVASMNPKNKEELLAQPFIKDQDVTVKDMVEQAVGKIGENIQIIEIFRMEL